METPLVVRPEGFSPRANSRLTCVCNRFPAASRIHEHCVLGGIWDARDHRELSVTHVLLLSSSEWVEQLPAQLLGLTTLALNIGNRFTELSGALSQGLEFLNCAVRSGDTVLVVCGDDKGTSSAGPVVVAAHLSERTGDGLVAAIGLLQEARPFALLDPEIEVVEQLAGWDAGRPTPTDLATLKLRLGIEDPASTCSAGAPGEMPLTEGELSDEVWLVRGTTAPAACTLHALDNLNDTCFASYLIKVSGD